jgi:hypothetical protein
MRAISKVAIPAAMAKLANVCLSAYGVRCSSPAARTAEFQWSRRQLCSLMWPPFTAGNSSGESMRGGESVEGVDHPAGQRDESRHRGRGLPGQLHLTVHVDAADVKNPMVDITSF